jgi:DNA-binding NarL/FixJ family response regulator
MAHQDINIGLQSFTRYERDILKLAADGYMDQEIAVELSISERTVKEIQVNLMRRWNVHTFGRSKRA